MTIQSLAALGGRDAHPKLAQTALRIFGGGSRSPGWIRQKLHRECVDADMSVVATEGDAWLGYVLVGTPPSLNPVARTAGVGVVPEEKGQGLGTALLEAAADSAARRGRVALQSLAVPEMASFYERAGFDSLRPHETWQATGTGEGSPAAKCDPGPWTQAAAPVQLAAWYRETHERTDATRRHSVRERINGQVYVAHLTREGQALVAHRLCVGSEGLAQAALRDLRNRAQGGQPLFITGVDPRPLRSALAAAGYGPAQPAELMERTLT